MTSEIVIDDKLSLFSDEKPSLEVRNVIKDMVDFAKSLIVDNEGAYKSVTSLYRQAREWKKTIEAKRKEMTDPFRKQMAAINDKAKELTDPLDQVIDIANSKVSAYQLMLQEKQKQEEERVRGLASLFDAQEELYIPPIEPARGDGAICVTRKEKRFRVVDLTKVPAKYLMVDETAVKKDLQLGISEIPGLEVYEETITQLRTR